MQVLACILLAAPVTSSLIFGPTHAPHDIHEPHLQHARIGRATAMMAPVIIMGAIMMFVFWDTSEPL